MTRLRRQIWQMLPGRRGMTVIVVLGVLSITLALSYAMLRSQVTSVQIQSNLDRRNLARQAAYSGVSAAIRSMHSSSWGGVSSTLNQNLASDQWFEASYATGDESLTSASTDYSEYPFRVTITSIGYAADPAQPDITSSYKVKAVVELVRRKLQPAPSIWTAIRNVTAFQWSGNACFFEVPMRVEGPMYIQSPITLGSDYPVDSSSRQQYFYDLLAMKNANAGDYRPFSGPIYTPSSKQSGSTRTMLETGLGLTLVDVPVSTSTPISHPGSVTYQLYPGGKTYTPPTLQTTYGSTISNATIAPDPVSNPLGIYNSTGTLFLGNNAKVTGTIITSSGTEPDIRINGTNVNLQAYTLPQLYGSSVPYQLPVAIVKDDFQIESLSSSTIHGVVVAYDEFTFIRGDVNTTCNFFGRVASSKLYLYGRIPWDLASTVWQLELTTFNVQKLLVNGIKYFPQWMKNGYPYMDPNPTLTIKPDSAEIVHHWHTWGQPVYIAGDGDAGLKWNLIDWTDNPSN
jgi:hypothetical protein